jgi:hypothetical protein
VDNWLSSPRDIPQGALEIIRRLMAEDVERAKDKADPEHHLILTVPLDEFRRWEQAALHEGATTTDYCVGAIREAYHEDMGKGLSKLAETEIAFLMVRIPPCPP